MRSYPVLATRPPSARLRDVGDEHPPRAACHVRLDRITNLGHRVDVVRLVDHDQRELLCGLRRGHLDAAVAHSDSARALVERLEEDKEPLEQLEPHQRVGLAARQPAHDEEAERHVARDEEDQRVGILLHQLSQHVERDKGLACARRSLQVQVGRAHGEALVELGVLVIGEPVCQKSVE